MVYKTEDTRSRSIILDIPETKGDTPFNRPCFKQVFKVKGDTNNRALRSYVYADGQVKPRTDQLNKPIPPILYLKPVIGNILILRIARAQQADPVEDNRN